LLASYAAASTAAFSTQDVGLVAMPSITLMMSLIFLLLALISSIVVTTWPHHVATLAPQSALLAATDWPGAQSPRFGEPCW
jgi:hypothetical protein